jgi:hypothetical protein
MTYLDFLFLVKCDFKEVFVNFRNVKFNVLISELFIDV